MEHPHTHNDHDSCCNITNNIGVRQSLPEMEFERGIWYAGKQFRLFIKNFIPLCTRFKNALIFCI